MVSVLFVDLVGFTAHTAQSDPEDVRARLTVYHRKIREDVERFGGRVEKLMGDGVFAVFGAPVAHEDDPERAVRAALRMRRSVDDLNAGDPELSLSIRVAVTTGEAIVQISGGDRDREGIIGDVVNTASRLEEVAPPGGVVVDERTYLSTRDVVVYADLDPVEVKGKAEPLPIWQPLEARSRFGVDVDRRHSTPFVGRDAELGALVDAFERTVRERTVQLVTIIGEPGVGKSRLLNEFRETIDARPDIAWWRQGRCLPYGEGITFWALAEIVKAHAGILESDTGAEAKLHAAVKPLFADSTTADWVKARLSPLAGVGGAADTVDQAELFSAWSRFLEALATRNPLILVVEDLHWADEAMLDFLEHLTDWAVSSPILVVTTARPELYSVRDTWGGGKRNAAAVSLSPLDTEHAAVLLGALLEATVLDESVQQAILERSEGNPLYVTEFVRLADDQGLLQDAAGIGDLPLPGSVQAIVAARLDLLKPEQKATLQAAAVVGKVFWLGALQAMRSAPDSSLLVRNLVRRELIRPVRDPSMLGQEEYAFSHSVIRDVAYGQIPRGDRAQLHEAAASWIEAVTGPHGHDSAELVAYHLGEAMLLSSDPHPDLRMRSYRVNMQAGDRTRGLNPTRAAGYYRTAADVAQPGKDRALALLELGPLSQDPDQTGPIYDEALALYRNEGDVEGQALALVAKASLLWWRGDTAGADKRGAEAMELLDELPDGAAKAKVLTGRASGFFLRGQAAEALDLAEKAAPVVASAGTIEDQIRLLYSRGGALVELGDASGVEYLENAAEIALDRNMTGAATTALNNLATVVALMRSTDEGLMHIDKGLRLAEERGLPIAANWHRFTKSEILMPMGRWDEVLELTNQVIDRDAKTGGSQAGTGAAAIRAVVLFHRGREQEARELFEPLLETARAIKDQQVLAPVLSFAVELAYDAGDDAAVLALSEEFDQATADAPAFRSYFVAAVAAALADTGHHDFLERLVGSTRPVGAAGDVQVAISQGLLEFSREEMDKAADRFASAVTFAEKAGRVLDLVLSQIGQARALLALGRKSEASDLLTSAHSTAESMGAVKLISRIDELGDASSGRAIEG
ncbi:MAG: AAA family ATPase [Acidimicrobiia bacterium]|nr:AAA family ATPase [Acidimicrobiia bacterium]MDX2467382.1 AAA family ATPase [Acidimicrobiia bacterium]